MDVAGASCNFEPINAVVADSPVLLVYRCKYMPIGNVEVVPKVL